MNASQLSAAEQRATIALFQARGANSEQTAATQDELGILAMEPIEKLIAIGVVHRGHAEKYWYDHGAALDYQDGQHGKLIIGAVMLFLLVAGTWATYLVLTTMM
ncbi:MAG: hypothetical protein ACI9D0_000360 [Bacteroidia bacterium]|jgi:hypothetical protein